MADLYEWVRNIVIYLILNTIIMNLLGASSYKKYVSIVSGMILLLIVVTPFLKLLKMDDILDYYLHSNIYQADVSDFQSELRLMEDKQRDIVCGAFKDRIRDQVADILESDGLYLYSIDLVMNQDVESSRFGEIEELKINAGYLEDQGIPAHKINVKKIVISKIDRDKNNKDDSVANLPSPEEIHIKNRLSDFYNMKEDNINISIQG